MNACPGFILRLCATLLLAASLAGCTVLTIGTPEVPEMPSTALTSADAAIIQAAVGASLPGEAFALQRLTPGAFYTSTRYRPITAFTVCGQAQSASAVHYFIGYLSRERGTFEIAGIAASGPEQKSIVALCLRRGADTTALALH